MVSEGDRIRLISTTDQYTDLDSGDEGIVTGTRRVPENISPQNKPELQIHVDWDSGSTLSLVESQDSFEVIDGGD